MNLLESKNFIRALWLLVILSIIFMAEKVSFVFYPLGVFFKIFFIPVSFAIVFYYIFIPFVDLLEKRNIKRLWGTVILFVLIVAILVVSVFLLGSTFEKQLARLSGYLPFLTDYLKQTFESLKDHPFFADFQEGDFAAVERITEYLSVLTKTFFDRVGSDFSSFFSFISNTVIGIILLPVFLFYMLIDIKKLYQKVMFIVPEKHKVKTEKMLNEIHLGLNGFIRGRVIVSFLLAVLSYIGYVILGLEAPLVLAVIIFFTNFIPYIGPILGAIPALVIALISSFALFIKVLIFVIAAQQIESIFISPQVMSKTLSMHPVIVITTVILGGHFFGILGILFAVPAYIIIKVLTLNLLPEEYSEKIKKRTV